MSDDWFKPGKDAARAQKDTNRGAKPKFGLLRLIIFGMIAFWIFAKFFKPPAGAEGNIDGGALPADRGANAQPQIPERPLPGGSGRPLPGRDWRIDEVDTAGDRPTTGPRRSIPRGDANGAPSGRDDRGDWSIDEVETDSSRSASDEKKSSGDNANDGGVRFDPGGNAGQTDRPDKTTKGDWSIEEVETEK